VRACGFGGVTGTDAQPINLAGTSPTSDPYGGQGRTCVVTNSQGNAAVELFDSNPNSVDVVAEYVQEGLLRHVDVNFGTPASSGGTSPAGTPVGTTTSSAPTATNSGTSAPTSSQLAAVRGSDAGPTTASAVVVKSAKFKTRVVMGQILRRTGKPSRIEVGVASTKKTAHIRVVLRNKKGKVLRSVTRTIKTNRLVLISHLKVPRGTHSVKVTLIK